MKQTRATKIGFGILMQRGKGVIGILVQKAVLANDFRSNESNIKIGPVSDATKGVHCYSRLNASRQQV